MRYQLFGVVIASVAFASALSAQSGSASISGNILDKSGAVIQGASTSIKNSQTNITRTAVSNAEGRYSLTNLSPGIYVLTAEVAGFKSLRRDNLVLQIGDRVGLDLVMEVGSAADRVTVTDQVPLLRTEDSQSGLVIDNKRIQELPQYNRDPLAFTLLAPNVNGTSERGGDLRINGGRAAQIENFVDGVPMTTGYDHSVPNSIPGREAVGEFKVMYYQSVGPRVGAELRRDRVVGLAGVVEREHAYAVVADLAAHDRRGADDGSARSGSHDFHHATSRTTDAPRPPAAQAVASPN